MIQMLSWPSTAMPATWPRIQFSGSGFGQNGSGWNFGAACWAAPSAAAADSSNGGQTSHAIDETARTAIPMPQP